MPRFQPSFRTHINAFQAMAVFDAATAKERNGEAVYHLEVGQPGTGAPPSAVAAVRAALDKGQVMGYTPAVGLEPLREGLAAYYQRRYGAQVKPRNIVVTNGSSAGFVLSFLASFEPGARVGLTAPGYPAYRHILSALGYQPVLIPVDANTRYQPTVAHLEACGPLDGFILASPGNPTGTMVTPVQFTALHDWCEASGCRLVSDEIYHGLTWGQREATAAGRRGSHAIIVNSFSKYFSMTGWRVGWLILPDELVEPVERLAQNMFICAPVVSQVAALGALDDLAYLDTLRDQYRQNADTLQAALARVGLGGGPEPDGGFYAYVDISQKSNDASRFAADALAQAGVAIVPGVDFDPANGNRFVRLSVAGAFGQVEQGANRLADWIDRTVG